MKHLRYILPLLAIVLALGCNKAGNSTAGNKETSDSLYSTVPEAAAAARADIAAIIDSIPLGFTRDSFEISAAHTAIHTFSMEAQDILNADSNASFGSLPKTNASLVVPYISTGNMVTTVATLYEKDGKYGIGQLVNYPMAQELRSVRQLLSDPSGSDLFIVHIHAVNGRLYVASVNNKQIYFYAVNNIASASMGRTWPQMLTTLKEEITFYQNKFGKDGDANLYW